MDLETSNTIAILPEDFPNLKVRADHESGKVVVLRALKRLFPNAVIGVSPGHVGVSFQIDNIRLVLLSGWREINRCRFEINQGAKEAHIIIINTTLIE